MISRDAAFKSNGTPGIRMNIRTLISPIVLISQIFLADAAADQANRYRPMAESMFDMMDAFSSTYQKRMNEQSNDWNRSRSDESSWSGGMPAWSSGDLPLNMGGMPMSPMMSPWTPWGMNSMPQPGKYLPQNLSPYFNWRPAVPARGPLDGEWEDPLGNGLVIRNRHFRITQSDNRYSEGYLVLETAKILSMQPHNNEIKHYYEYAVQGGKLALRDSSGNLFLFRRKHD